MIKPVEGVESKKINSLREGNRNKSENFEMEIIDEGAVYKTLEGSEKPLDWKKHRRQFMST